MAESEENVTMEGSPPGKAGFWQRSREKISERKIRFMPNRMGGGDSKQPEADDGSGLTPKQRRRAQVRKAQIEHRQRKENYVKHLEQDVINLRALIAQTESQSQSLQHENTDIKSTLQKSRIPLPAPVPKARNEDEMDIDSLQDMASAVPPISPLGNMYYSPSGSSDKEQMLVSVTFDELIDADCLQISSIDHTFEAQGRAEDEFDASHIYNFPVAFNAVPVGAAAPLPVELPGMVLPPLGREEKELPALPKVGERGEIQGQGKGRGKKESLASVAINFILALEHPCRTHFPPPTGGPFDPLGPHTGHELMASTLLYSSAPPSSYPPCTLPPFKPQAASLPTSPSPTNSSHPSTSALYPEPIEEEPHIHGPPILSSPPWTHPSSADRELDKLHAMASSLPVTEEDITPVQAWFELVKRYGEKALVDDDENIGGIGGGGGFAGIGGGFGGGGISNRNSIIGGWGGEEKKIERLKRALGKLVDCFEFGAVIDRRRFWGVVEGEIGSAGR